jgi:hypothetical protein
MLEKADAENDKLAALELKKEISVECRLKVEQRDTLGKEVEALRKDEQAKKIMAKKLQPTTEESTPEQVKAHQQALKELGLLGKPEAKIKEMAELALSDFMKANKELKKPKRNWRKCKL